MHLLNGIYHARKRASGQSGRLASSCVQLESLALRWTGRQQTRAISLL